jgi:hypothetical protein
MQHASWKELKPLRNYGSVSPVGPRDMTAESAEAAVGAWWIRPGILLGWLPAD